MANEVTGKINTQYNKVEDFFHLQQENRRLHRENDSLLNMLPVNFVRHDTGVQSYQDTNPQDSTGFYRRYFLYPATVTYTTVSSQKNYIQIPLLLWLRRRVLRIRLRPIKPCYQLV